MKGEHAFAEALRPILTGTQQEIEDAIVALRSISLLVDRDHEENCDAHGDATLGWVIRGIVRKYVIHANGQRRIIDLLMAGDFFGLSDDEDRSFSLQAITDDTCIARCSRGGLLALAALRPAIDRLLHDGSHQSIARLESHQLAQGRTRASEKVGAYLLSMARRMGRTSSRVVEIPVSRYDIADHLGIAVETVSRAITNLRNAGTIAMETPRQLTILDSERLSETIL